MENRARLAFLVGILSCLPLAAQSASAPANPRATLSLAGAWRFELDAQNQGVDAKWYARPLGDSVQLPGTTDTNRKGRRNDAVNPQRLSRRWEYSGKAWYQRDVDIAPAWAGKRVALFLERTRVTQVWLDGSEAGARQTRLSVPHVYDLGTLSPGRHRVTILVDNAAPLPAGGHLVSEDTQTNWNGILGRIELIATPQVWLEKVRVTPDVKRRTAVVRVEVRNQTGTAFDGVIALRAESFNTALRSSVEKMVPLHAAPGVETADIELAMGASMATWDEFSPALYRLTANLRPAAARSDGDRVTVEFGMREFGAAGMQLAVNGKKTFLRGRHDSGVWPLTGFPPMDLDSWLGYFRTLKTYGLNHVRFHSWCPPEAAFQAADREGFYLQPELPLWGSVPDRRQPDRVPYLTEEGKAIFDSFGKSPAFCMFSLGNELGGDRAVMAGLIADFRKYDPRHLYASGTNSFLGSPKQQAGDDFWVTMRTRNGESGRTRASYSHADLPLGHIETGPPGTRNDYAAALQGVTIPVIGHEVGQYEVFPNFDEIPKYTGVLEARNLAVLRDRLQKAGMLDQAKDFFRSSGALAVECYREDIEAALRTPGFAGFQLLDVQDYPGQGTALVGILDAFMDSKGLIEPRQWRQFCDRTVPLLRFDKYVWSTAESFAADVSLSHFGPTDLPDARLGWTLTGPGGKALRSGTLRTVRVSQGSLAALGALSIPLAGLAAPARYDITLTLAGTQVRNSYPLWLFPEAADTAIPANVSVTRTLDAAAKSRLEAGGTVVLFPQLKDDTTSSEVLFMTDFWCYPMFKGIAEGQGKRVAPGTMGLLLDPRHPAFRDFPTSSYSGWQWWNLVKNGRALILDDAPAGFRPVLQVVDNAFRDRKFGMIVETRVGRGKLLICGIDLPGLQQAPEARQLMRSLLRYAASAEFNPTVALDDALLARLLGGGR